MTSSHKVPKMTLDPCPREICVEFDRNISTRRKELRHPPSSITRGRKRPKIWKDSNEQIVRSTLRYDSVMKKMEQHIKNNL
jgi:hypothetical protein